MSKGSAPAGQTTTSTVNPVQQMQQPYLGYGWGEAQNLYQNQPQQYYPGQTLATPNPYTAQGYQNIYGTGQSIDQTLRPQANQVYGTAAAGGYGVENSPAYGGYQSYATGTAYPQQQQQAIAQGAQNVGNTYAPQIGAYGPQQAGYAGQMAANNNLGLSQLGQASSGYYLPGAPGSNPYFDATVNAALQPLERSYQTVTAPSLAGMYSGGGRYGSGAMAGAADTAEQNYLDAAGDVTSKMSYDVYNAERQRQDAAASQYGQLYNQGLSGGISGLGAAANTGAQAGQLQLQGLQTAGTALNNYAANQQYGLTGLQSGYQSGNQAAMNALSAYPNLAQAQYGAADAAVRAGEGLTALDQKQIADEMARYYGEQSAPYTNLNTYLEQIGAKSPVGGTGTVSNPYFTNPTANALAGISGATGIANNLGLTGSLGGLLGTAPIGASAVAAGAPAVISPAITGAGLSSLAAMNTGATAAALAPAAAWIVCTELRRQGRMSPEHWRAGVRVFDGYPMLGKRGYWVWAIPAVRHLRKHPDSLLSRLLGAVFRWRAEDLAARAGVKGARKLWRGRAVTAALWVPCLALGALVGKQDWRQVYREESAA